MVETSTPLTAGRRSAPSKRFAPPAQNLDAGAIHLPRADEIQSGPPRAAPVGNYSMAIITAALA